MGTGKRTVYQLRLFCQYQNNFVNHTLVQIDVLNVSTESSSQLFVYKHVLARRVLTLVTTVIFLWLINICTALMLVMIILFLHPMFLIIENISTCI